MSRILVIPSPPTTNILWVSIVIAVTTLLWRELIVGVTLEKDSSLGVDTFSVLPHQAHPRPPPPPPPPLPKVQRHEKTTTTEMRLPSSSTKSVIVSSFHHPTNQTGVTTATVPKTNNYVLDCEKWLQSLRPIKNTTTSTSTRHKTIYVPGYPGSGSELFRTLIVSLTGGMEAADWYLKDQGRCNHHPATCKTHCPVLNKCPTTTNAATAAGNDKEDEQQQQHNPYAYYHESAILLLRNPQKALPSRVNFMWERLEQHQVETHQHQAPEAFWKQTRNEKFGRLLGGWKRLLLHWTNTVEDKTKKQQQQQQRGSKTTFVPQPYNVSLILPYEHMISPQRGPFLLQQLVHELRQANIPVQIPTTSSVATTKTTIITSQDETIPTSTTAAGTTTITTTTTHNHHQQFQHQQRQEDQWCTCLWQHVVQNKNSKTRRKDRSYEPGFTRRQQTSMIKMLDDLIHLFKTTATSSSSSSELVELLQQYRTDISTNLRIDDD